MKKYFIRKNAKEIPFLIIVVILVLISIFNVTITTAQKPGFIYGEDGIFSQTKESIKISPTEIKYQSMDRNEIIFSQRPYTPDESYSFYTSDSNSGYLCQDDFWNLSDVFGEVYWYGLSLIFDNGWTEGNPTGMQFEIIFYEDNEGYPGNVIATFSDLEPILKNTGLSYSTYTMYYWEVPLPYHTSLVNGWISIQSTYCPDGSWFLWSGSPEGNFNAMQSNNSIGDNLAYNLTGGWFIPHLDIKIDSIIQPLSGPAGVIAPIVNISNIGNMDRIFPINVQITSSTLEYNQTKDNIHLWPGDSQQIIFPDWTPDTWNNTIENKTIEYTIVVSAIIEGDCNQSDNTMTKSFNLTYTCELHRLYLIGFISNKTQDNNSTSFIAKNLFFYDYNNYIFSRFPSGEKIFVSRSHQLGFIGKNFVIGRFNGVAFSISDNYY